MELDRTDYVMAAISWVAYAQPTADVESVIFFAESYATEAMERQDNGESELEIPAAWNDWKRSHVGPERRKR